MTERLQNPIRVATNFEKIQKHLVPFHTPAFNPSAKLFLGKLRADFVDHHIESSLKFVGLLTTPLSHTRTRSSRLLQMFFSCFCSLEYYPKDYNGVWKVLPEGRQGWIIRNRLKVFSDFDPALPEALVVGNAADLALRITRKRRECF